MRAWLGPNQPGHQRGPRPAALRPGGVPERHRARGRARRSVTTRGGAKRRQVGLVVIRRRARRGRWRRRRSTPAPDGDGDGGGGDGVDGTGAPTETPAGSRSRPKGRRPTTCSRTSSTFPNSALEDLPDELQDSLLQLGSGRQERRRRWHPADRRGGGAATRLPVLELMTEPLTKTRAQAGRRRGAPARQHRRLADDGRRGHGPDRDRRRVPRLQREQRPAVRSGLPGLGRGPERRAADQQQRGPDRRPPRRRGRVDRARSAGRASRLASARANEGAVAMPQPEARQVRRAAAEGLGLPGPLPLRVRPQVPRDHPRHRRGRARGLHVRRHRRRDDLRAAAQPVDIRRAALGQRQKRLLPGADRVRRHRQHLRRTDARERACEPLRVSATPSPGAAPR